MFYGCFYSIVLNSQIYFCLVLRKSKEGWRPLRLCLGQRKKKCKLSVQLEALNTPALMSQTCQRVKMESRNSQGTLWKKSPGRDQHLQKLKEASMMQLLKGSLLGQGQTFCQGEGILISQTGNGHLIVSTGQSGLHLPLHQHPINPSLQERQRPHYHQDQGQQRPHCFNQDSDSSSDLDDCFATYSCGFDIKWYTTSQHYTTKTEGMSNDNFARILDTERFLFE